MEVIVFWLIVLEFLVKCLVAECGAVIIIVAQCVLIQDCVVFFDLGLDLVFRVLIE